MKKPPEICKKSIDHGQQMQALCAQSFSCKFSVARFQNTLYVVDGKFADSDVQKRACDYAHHIVKEAVARHGYAQFGLAKHAVIFLFGFAKTLKRRGGNFY